MVIRRIDRKERKGKIEIYIRVVAAGVVGCDCDSFLEHLGHGLVDSEVAAAMSSI